MSSKTSSATAIAASQGLTTPELEQARLYLEQTRNGAVGATKGLSDAQWKFKPAPERWSIAENLEHMVTVQDRVLGMIKEQLASAPAAPGDRDCAQVDAIVIFQFPDRLRKFPAPEFIHPAGRLAPAQAVDLLVQNTARLMERLESTPDLRRHALEAPPLKAVSGGAYDTMDGYQWILAAAAHTERHTKQILEVKADVNFPAS